MIRLGKRTTTTIQVSFRTRARLVRYMRGRESYELALRRLLRQLDRKTG